MPELLTTTDERDVDDAVADMQTPGVETTISGPNGAIATLEDPRRVITELSEIAETEDPGTSPWPHEDGEPVEYVEAVNAQEIGTELIGRILKLRELRPFRIHYLFRYKEGWTKKGKTVFGEMKKPTGLLQSYACTDFIVVLNWHVWDQFNAMQRVALVYHELRHGGEKKGKPDMRPHDFEGFFDELALFGTGTYRDWNALARAAERGADVRHQYSLSILDEA